MEAAESDQGDTLRAASPQLEEYLSDWEAQLESPAESVSCSPISPGSIRAPPRRKGSGALEGGKGDGVYGGRSSGEIAPLSRSSSVTKDSRRRKSSAASRLTSDSRTKVSTSSIDGVSSPGKFSTKATPTTDARTLAENLLAKTQTATKILRLVWTQHQQALIAKFEEELEAMRKTHAMTLRYTGQQLRTVLKVQQKKEEKDFLSQHELEMEILRNAKQNSIKGVRSRSKHALDVYNHAEALAALHITPSTPMLPFAATSALDRTITSILCASAFIETEINFAKSVDLNRVSDLVRRPPPEETSYSSTSSPTKRSPRRPQSAQRRRPVSAIRRTDTFTDSSVGQSASLDRTAASDLLSTTSSRLKCSFCHGFIPLRQKKIRIPLKEGSLQVAESGVRLNSKQFCSWKCAKQWTVLSEGEDASRPATATNSRGRGGFAHTWS